MLDINMKYNISEVSELSRRFPDISHQVRTEIVTEALALLQRDTVLGTPEGASAFHLREQWFTSLDYGEPVKGLLGNVVIYAKPVEYGTKPHMPPVAPLIPWVNTVLNITDPQEAKAVAWAIAFKIKRKGTDGAHMLEKAWAKDKSYIENLLRHIPEEIINRLQQ
jgi:hypothetical protein